MTTFKEVCAWCGFVIKEGVEPVSHGSCIACLLTQMSEIEDESKSQNS